MEMPNPINADELEFEEVFGDQLLYKGQPYTGLAREYWPDGTLASELPLKDGFKDGLCRYWYPNGNLKAEWVSVEGRAMGESKSWHQNGSIESVSYCEFGVATKADEWNANGEHIKHFELDPSSSLWLYIEKLRRESQQAS